MPKGGARARSGPPPDPNALRRDRAGDAEWMTLPTQHEIPAPAFPLPNVTQREAEVWSTLWAKPQAVAWHRFGLSLDVALYCRRFVEAEQPESSTSLSTLVRQLADSLGVSVPGMKANRWRLESEVVAAAEEPLAELVSARDRLRLLSDGAG